MATLGAKTGAGGKRHAPPSPSPSVASASSKTDGTPSKRLKRERDEASTPNPVSAAAAAVSANFGQPEIMTQLTYAVDYLKSKGAQKSLQDVLDHLTLQHMQESQQKTFAVLMQRHPRITFTPEPKKSKEKRKADGAKEDDSWKWGTYKFRAKIPGVEDKDSLLLHLRQKSDHSSVSVKDLKDGWPDCEAAIDELEKEHKILVVRTKKDNHAKMVWINEPRLYLNMGVDGNGGGGTGSSGIDPEFLSMWHKVELPSLDDIVRRLQAVGQKPASEDPRLKAVATNQKQKAKKRRSGKQGKTTNSHMAHLLQAYNSSKKA